MGQVAALRADLPGSLADRDLVEAPSEYGLQTLPWTHIRLADDGSEPAKAFVVLAAMDFPGHFHRDPG